ncbi:hypothetical protein [Nocardioides aurantiacus]|uniref:hypothetical protein n=1 Tax=Nocardioides aurantiacus TaxID=86796 RepID=UPI00403F535B
MPDLSYALLTVLVFALLALLAGVLDRYLAVDLDTDPADPAEPDASAPTRDRVAR